MLRRQKDGSFKFRLKGIIWFIDICYVQARNFQIEKLFESE